MAEMVNLAAEYRESRPFPHMTFGGCISPTLAALICGEFPAETDVRWRSSDGELEGSHPSMWGTHTWDVVQTMATHPFTTWLSELTGIPHLIADPGGYRWARFHSQSAMYRDSSDPQQLGLYRRIRCLLYLNTLYPPVPGGVAGGDLLLGLDRDVRITPEAGKLVVFSTGGVGSWYGHPEPLLVPDRKSLAICYLSPEPGRGTA